ncbi:imelysin family protein [Rhodoligotrophos defluvii]|uniref:imelysin family protein n=1 Tax=Rhodoligotrophos defluvii TaxID=2561934 RepID=UPI001484D9FD|nr:imelysin family protein [Rhodoligotrophos defluvii]
MAAAVDRSKRLNALARLAAVALAVALPGQLRAQMAPDTAQAPAAPADSTTPENGTAEPRAPQMEVQPVGMVELAKGLVAEHAAPGYRSFAAESAKLAAATAELCGAPNPRRLEAVRQAFTAALTAWQRVQHIRFGPVMQDDRYYRIEYWPDKHGQGEKQLRKLLGPGGLAGFDLNRIAQASVAIQGFPALERVLYGDAAEGLADTAPESAPACNLALAIARNLAAMAKGTAEAWQRDYVAPAASLTDAQARAIVTDFYRAFVEQLEVLRDLKLGAPMGKSPESARPKSAETWRSHMAERNLETNLRALADLFSGPKAGAVPGLAAAIDPKAKTANGGPAADLRKAAAEGLTYAAEFVAGHPQLLGEPLESEAGWKAADFLKLHLAGVRDHAVEVLGAALDASLGFNSRDGD